MPPAPPPPLRCWGFCPVTASAPTHEILAALGPEYTFVERMLAVNTVVVRGPRPASLPERFRSAPEERMKRYQKLSLRGDLVAYGFTPKEDAAKRPATDVVMVHVVKTEGDLPVFDEACAVTVLEEIGFDMTVVTKVFGMPVPKRAIKRHADQAKPGLFYVEMASPADALAALGQWDACFSPLVGGFVHIHQLCTSAFNEERAFGYLWRMTEDYARSRAVSASCLKARVPLCRRAIGYDYPRPAKKAPRRFKERLRSMFPRMSAETIHGALKSRGFDFDEAAVYLAESPTVDPDSSDDEGPPVVAAVTAAAEGAKPARPIAKKRRRAAREDGGGETWGAMGPADAQHGGDAAMQAGCEHWAECDSYEPCDHAHSDEYAAAEAAHMHGCFAAAAEGAKPARPIAKKRRRAAREDGGGETWGAMGPADAQHGGDAAMQAGCEHWAECDSYEPCDHAHWDEYPAAEAAHMHGCFAAAAVYAHPGCPYNAYPAPPPPPPAPYSHPSEAGSGSGDSGPSYAHVPYAADEERVHDGPGASFAGSGSALSAPPPLEYASSAASECAHSLAHYAMVQSCPPLFDPRMPTLCCGGGGRAQTAGAHELRASSSRGGDDATLDGEDDVARTLDGIPDLQPMEGSSAAEDGSEAPAEKHEEVEAVRALTRSCPVVPLTPDFAAAEDPAPMLRTMDPFRAPLSPWRTRVSRVSTAGARPQSPLQEECVGSEFDESDSLGCGSFVSRDNADIAGTLPACDSLWASCDHVHAARPLTQSAAL
eukprot:TRINITY_DN1457_c0_g1_i1.p1 TRINITY_DN1457_c0_g1~~TRINITY_DN1457_c0_g1_i1.p1  ORF type:complete len:767 (+),score=201.55 TRINITY_DN1457_c0_g1_i1:64-2364(+)